MGGTESLKYTNQNFILYLIYVYIADFSSANTCMWKHIRQKVIRSIGTDNCVSKNKINTHTVITIKQPIQENTLHTTDVAVTADDLIA